MRVRRIDHIGIAVEDEQEARRVLEGVLGCPAPIEETVEDQGVRTLIYKVGDAKVELLMPIDDQGPIKKHLETRGPGLHHLAFEVDDLPHALEVCVGQGLDLVDETPRDGVEGSEIAFLHPKSTFRTLLELVSFPDEAGGTGGP